MVEALHIRWEGATVALVTRNGAVSLPLGAAKEVYRALGEAIARIEEQQHAEQIALDSAVLMRSGAPFTLSNDKKILDVAKTEAAFNKDLRRAMPGGVKAKSVVGTPQVKAQ